MKVLVDSNVIISALLWPNSNPISDIKDQLILNAAIAADVDVIVSGDKHFLELKIDKPDIVNPSSFLQRYK